MACSPRSKGETRARSPDHGLQGITKLSRLVRGQLNNQTTAAFKRDPHHDAAPLLGDLKRTVTRPRLHRRHSPIPFLPAPGTAPRQGTAPPRGTARSGTPHAAIPGALGGTGQPQSSLSVALLSRVRQQNGNDRPCSLPSGRAQPPILSTLQRRPFSACSARALRQCVAGAPRDRGLVAPGAGTGGSDVGGKRQAAGPRADRPGSAAAVTRPAPAGPRGAGVRARHPADHGGSTVPGVPADPLVPRRRPGVAGPALPADRRSAAGRIGGRRHGPPPAADGGAGADGRLQRGPGGQHRPGDVAVAAVRPPGPGGRVRRAGRRRARRDRPEPGPAVRDAERERHLPVPVPVRPGGGPGGGRAAAGRGGGQVRVLAGRGQLRGGAAGRLPDLPAAPGRGARATGRACARSSRASVSCAGARPSRART